ncbi:hypothetical protein Poly41_63640 [Novipirellula artificiosorum]|uniref:Uncharacterized protein n=1 Tax=Novipirellula artificiosorum TaxID=2528016 RepID=A0A5C6D1W5_9BACT|nr:hypothetical protein Poly41_63640 [Novipirellula artificiosorum]
MYQRRLFVLCGNRRRRPGNEIHLPWIIANPQLCAWVDIVKSIPTAFYLESGGTHIDLHRWHLASTC